VVCKPRKKRTSKLEPLIPIIDGWLTEDIPRKRKDKRTAVKIYSDLANYPKYGKLLAVGRQTVLNYVNRKKAELYSKTYQTAMFTRHAMCEAKVDFGEVLVVTHKGAEEKWRELVLSFPWSNAGFVQLCSNETKECLEGEFKMDKGPHI
jgi:hypothetical protein